MNHIKNQEAIRQIQLSYENIPLAVFLLGTNGCGKSSLRNYLNLSDIQTNIDPDMLNRIYQNKYPNNYQVEAARQALKMYNDAINSKLNICIESTLAGRGTMQRIINAKANGYFVLVYYIGLDSVELNLKRIALRVASGGHDIPESTVRRRYNESATNLVLIKDYIDILHVVDNSDAFFRLQFSQFKQNTILYCKQIELWAEIVV